MAVTLFGRNLSQRVSRIAAVNGERGVLEKKRRVVDDKISAGVITVKI